MTRRLDITAMLTDPATRVVVCTGAGGVGKTTTAAAVALRAAELGRDTVVLTIDPARRLAQALGIDELSNEPAPVELGGAGAGGTGAAGSGSGGIGSAGSGSLHAMMLDMRRTFDELVVANTSEENARAILDNRFYKTMVTSFAGTQEYMAMEKLGQLLDDSAWDLVVVDTPPSRNALDFLDAPRRLGAFLDSRLMRLLSTPGRGVGRFVSGAMSTAMRGVSAVVGSSMLKDASEVVVALDSTFGGFTTRAARTQAILRRKGTEFLVVSSAERPALREAAYFAERLAEERMPLAGVVVNRTHPRLTDLSAEQACAAADRLSGRNAEAEAVLRIHADRAGTAKQELRLLESFTDTHPDVRIVGVPSLPFEISNLEALRSVGDQLCG
ncbi:MULTISPECIES: ArsA family ATPase [Dietzia]|uniref:ArsA family ATPase n=1 Tax=Dietzia TaxID=37914 RepID=UPI000D08E4DE|nr:MULTISPECIES: ArsA-related P-loop ATPase [Dietzia]AVM64427.1 anion transporter [Dietzia sp. oral taxon 368]MCT1713006.1 AAA family ATPase [Dietzia cinnamea]MCT2274733.1 AAA family ATPase [Dietzia cinnamea]